MPLVDFVLVGTVASNFAACERSDTDAVIDVELAQEQPDRYVDALEHFGFDVLVADTELELADQVFVEALAARADIETARVKVPAGLHLKSALSIADARTLLYDPGVGVDLTAFEAAGLECIAAPEPAGANVLALGSGRVLVSSAAPRTAELLAERRLRVVSLDMSEFHKADGALTCCSIRVPQDNAWCT